MVTNEIIQQGNNFVVISDNPISPEEYDSRTGWSDQNLIVPLLFNFYHGTEVLLKGFLASQGQLTQNHQLSGLLSKFSEFFPNNCLSGVLTHYITEGQLPEPLASFCSQSKITIDDYYQALKYPESRDGTRIYRHILLKYQSDAGLTFFRGLDTDIKQMRLDAVALGKSICPKT